MSEHWGHYFGLMDNEPASVVLDMEVSEEVDPKEFKYAFVINISLKCPNEDGFATDDEAEALNEIETAFNEFVRDRNYVFVGRITCSGERDLFFYYNKVDKQVLFEATKRYLDPEHYKYNVYSIDEDEPWEIYYTSLYPNLYQLQHMGNADVVEALEESGDPLEVARKVEHWLLFEDSRLMDKFTRRIKKEGFIIEEKSRRTDENDKYTLVISRNDKVDLDSMNEITDFLIDLLEDYNGEYDGWETFVVK
ncbi:DUF695 domain-containing protein [Alteribacter aurantiacus]|uniref:DUF695 domain-containing protein n=1 Tax=Alteribacter aurantiacus TaxID=254410 RepID=UPI00040924EA|nr:DUF695 domain-containing protein [Alteribacter aurantiacus]